jgi:hypothetical protein
MTQDIEQLLNTVAEFTWNFNMYFYVDTGTRWFIYSDPDYNGDGSLVETKQSYSEWIKPIYGRDKGKHVIKNYCEVSKVVLLDGTEFVITPKEG